MGYWGSAMLRIVLVNLISNALKFTRSRAPAEIEIGWLREQGSEIVIFVRDNGVGFDMNFVDKLFGVFQRLHRAMNSGHRSAWRTFNASFIGMVAEPGPKARSIMAQHSTFHFHK
jgi:hypothetical protein